ncbi:hypothetical protein [Botrimarina colliarenosi]|nr:hypothetical protein [Botrimarina colliarenosi]
MRLRTAATLLCLIAAIKSDAAITATGDYSPAYDGVSDPWEPAPEIDLFVGNTAAGTLTIDGDSQVLAGKAYFGVSSGGDGAISVVGDGAILKTVSDLFLGNGGRARLELVDGGRAIVGGVTQVHRVSSSYPTAIQFDGGILETGSLFASPDFLEGDGAIYANGLVSDFDLTFDTNHETSQDFLFDSIPEQNVELHLSPAVSTGSFHHLGAGFRNSATLTISDGQNIQSEYGTLGKGYGSNGRAIITGAGSTWEITNHLAAGNSGVGEVVIEQGAHLHALNADIGSYFSNASLRVSGVGSLFTGEDVYVSGDTPFVVDDAAKVQVANYFIIGGASSGGDAFPVVTVTGAGSEIATENFLAVGSSSAAQLRVEEGGRVYSPAIRVGSIGFDPGQLLVTGPESQVETDFLEIKRNSWRFGASDTIGPTSVLVEQGAMLKVNTRLKSALNSTYEGPGFALRDGGRLALPGDREGSLTQFLDGTEINEIRYWDGDNYETLLSATLGVDYTLEYQGGGDLAGFTLLTVGVLPTIDGDYNGDGVVNAVDYTVWRDRLDSDATLPGDTTPGTVTQQDYEVWAANYGNVTPNNGTQPVPEPNGLLLAAVLTNLLVVCHRQ